LHITIANHLLLLLLLLFLISNDALRNFNLALNNLGTHVHYVTFFVQNEQDLNESVHNSFRPVCVCVWFVLRGCVP